MAWNQFLSLVFRGNSTNDPTAEGYTEQEIAIISALPYRVFEGDSWTAVGGAIESPQDYRRRIVIDCKPFKTRAQSSTAQYQDYGDFLNLTENVLTKPYVWIYRAYEANSSGVLPRAGTDGTNSFWNLTTDTPAGVLPLAVVVEDLPEPETDTDSGTATVSFTVLSRNRI